jgi:hypothetical protein
MARRVYTEPTQEPAAPPAPAIGHNQPPRPLSADEVRAWLTDTTADLSRRRAEILGGIDRFLAKYPTIDDDDVQSRATDFAGQRGAIATWLQLAETRRVAEKDPFLQAERAVDAHFKGLTSQVVEGRKTIVTRMTRYAEKKEAEQREAARKEAAAALERARKAEEEALKTLHAERLDEAVEAAQEAERWQARAQAPAAELSRVHGALGGPGVVSSLRTSWKFDEANSNLMELVKAVADGRAPIAYLQFSSTRIGYAIRSEGVRKIPGCVIKEVRSI